MTGYDGPRAEVGVIGGSGFYSLLSDAAQVSVPTPWGEPSEPPAIGMLGGRAVAFLPRHGRDHRFPPHRVPYRANLWALHAVGVRQVLAPSAVGALRPDLAPGTLVVPDQVVDRTWGRAHTFYDEVPPVHVAFADPYCPRGRAATLRAAYDREVRTADGGTLVVINGPRFSSRAESRWHAAQGWSIVGMTAMPEAALARELALCYTSLSLVTDADAGVEGAGGVTHDEVLRVFADNVERLRALVADVVEALPRDGDCSCRRSLDGVHVPLELP